MAHSGCCCVPLSGFWDSASTRHLATLLSLADLLPGGHSCDTRQRVSWQGKLSAHFEWIRVPKWSSNLYRGLVSHALLGFLRALFWQHCWFERQWGYSSHCCITGFRQLVRKWEKAPNYDLSDVEGTKCTKNFPWLVGRARANVCTRVLYAVYSSGSHLEKMD